MNLNFLSISKGKKIPIQRLKKVNTVVFASGKWVLVVKQGRGSKGNFHFICASIHEVLPESCAFAIQ